MRPTFPRRFSQYRGMLMLGLFALILLAAPAQAAGAGRSTTVMYSFATDEPIDGSSSTLVRNDNGLSMTIRTNGLEPGHAFTVWWVVFNNPENCQDGFDDVACGPGDVILLGGTEGVVGYATGNVVGNSGRSGFGAHLKVGDSGGFLEPLLLGLDHDGLTNPRAAEIHLIVLDHGPMQPHLMPDQIHDFFGGCDELAEGCQEVQFTVHLAP